MNLAPITLTVQAIRWHVLTRLDTFCVWYENHSFSMPCCNFWIANWGEWSCRLQWGFMVIVLNVLSLGVMYAVNAWLLSIGPLGTILSEILIKIQNFSFTKMHVKITSAKWRRLYPGGDALAVTKKEVNPIIEKTSNTGRGWGSLNFTCHHSPL